ncbi:MerR family transcriptional regulator [Pseudonocardia ailaonensis]|uniref:MerR family transcriptional regulator n=1 Tax=Pseudonocardia ailaonensis TaxID=367279 RepID=UPI0031DAC06B
MSREMTIGDFAVLTHLSIRTLRKYHEAGLLEPAHVDPFSGYRRYTAEQIPTAQVIHRFRRLDMPLKEIREVLATEDPAARAALIAEHLDRLERRLDETRAAVLSLRRLLAPAEPDVVYRTEPERVVTAVEAARVALDDSLRWYSEAMTALDAAVAAAGARPTGPPGGRYDNALFADGAGHATVFVPTDPPVDAGPVHALTLPAGELAVTVHPGPHDDIDVTYGALGRHLAEHALTVAGPVHETYLVGPRDTSDPAAWRTEIGWPVFRTAAR